MTTLLHRIKTTAIKGTVATVSVITLLEVTTHIPSQGIRSNDLYMTTCDKILTPLIRTYLNPELAHDLAILALKHNVTPKAHIPKTNVNLSSQPFKKHPQLKFTNCIGLAAGFDKNGVAINSLFDLGFGFVEIGTVTPRAQGGNPKPRMFRLREDEGVINRYGFNSEGMEVVLHNLALFRGEEGEDVEDKVTKVVDGGWWAYVTTYTNIILERIYHHLPHHHDIKSKIVGVNIGKNKSTAEGEETIQDYVQCIQSFSPYADYIVINLSSPNTPGLRDLQKSESLERLFQAIIQPQSKIPILLKIAPDLSNEDMQDISNLCMQYEIDGIIVSNTTISRPSNLLSSQQKQTGGLSGKPLKSLSTDCIRSMYKYTNGTIPIIGVGGIFNGQDAYEKLCAGASLVQIYTAMVYNGPGVVCKIQKELMDVMVMNGYKELDDVIGLDHDEIYWKRKLDRMKFEREKEDFIVDDQVSVRELETILNAV